MALAAAVAAAPERPSLCRLRRGCPCCWHQGHSGSPVEATPKTFSSSIPVPLFPTPFSYLPQIPKVPHRPWGTVSPQNGKIVARVQCYRNGRPPLQRSEETGQRPPRHIFQKGEAGPCVGQLGSEAPKCRAAAAPGGIGLAPPPGAHGPCALRRSGACMRLLARGALPSTGCRASPLGPAGLTACPGRASSPRPRSARETPSCPARSGGVR